jgi:hypothetical protein
MNFKKTPGFGGDEENISFMQQRDSYADTGNSYLGGIF